MAVALYRQWTWQKPPFHDPRHPGPRPRSGRHARLARSLSARQSFSLARLTVAEVERGPLVCDVAGEGKVVAAVSPTLYAGNAGTVSLLVQAGDPVQRGRALARIESPDLKARLAQERSNADALKSESLRAEADARQQRAQAQGSLNTATIAHKTALNDLARQTQAFEVGATAGMQVDQARDAVARAQVALKQAKDLLGLQDDVSDRMNVAKDARLLSVVDLSQLEVQMQVAESFARAWSESSSTGAAGSHPPRPPWPFSPGSRAGTTRAAGTAASVRNRLSTSKRDLKTQPTPPCPSPLS